MNSKKKNKNRQYKPPNPIPPQKHEVIEPLNPGDVTNTELESVFEERVPNIISENAPAEIKETEETPKKPKRNRGKKKKDDEKSDKVDEVKSEELVLETEIQPSKELLDETNIAPTARKKKNKKGQGSVQAEKVEEVAIEKDARIDDGTGQTEEQPITLKEQEPEQSTKKKNKKKKNRHDSERSDKAQEVSCTSAFQKLLSEDVKVETNTQPTTDDSSVSDATVKEVEIATQAYVQSDTFIIETLQKDEGNKNKKKNKKDKKTEQIQSPKIVMSNTSRIGSEAVGVENLEHHGDDLTIPSCSTSDENTLKNKSNITRTKKGKCNQYFENEGSEIKPDNVKEIQISQIETKEETPSDVVPTEDFDDVILIPLTEITPDWHEEVITEEGNGPVIGCEDKNERIILEQQCKQHERNKSRKKSPKPPTKAGKTESSDAINVLSNVEPTTSSKQMTEQKPEVKLNVTLENNSEKKVEHQKNKLKNMVVYDDGIKVEKEEKINKFPKTSTQIESTSGCEIPIATSSATFKTDEVMAGTRSNLLEQEEVVVTEKQEDSLGITPQEKNPPLNEPETMAVSGGDDDNIRNKSSKKDEKVSSSAIFVDIVQPELTPFAEALLPQPLAPETELEIQSNAQDDKNKAEKDDIERVHTPESVKRHKNKKSPKFSVDVSVASGAKSTHKSKQNVLDIKDIIIIQAEVVSEEKAQKGDSFIAREGSIEKTDTNKKEVKHDSEKPKKRKKSPKPPQRDSMHEMKCNTESDCVETQGEVQLPVTPKPEDRMFLPDMALELDKAKLDTLPSPNEVTPDFIEHPRCSSEQLDSNNNMVIQEVQQSDTHLIVPVRIPETPFIQSISGPEITSSAVRVFGMETDSKPKEEKTDLKSKVLEVNQDMEELRMSIERSLAELTSLEKSDRDAEKKIESTDSANRIEVIQEILISEDKSSSVHTVLPEKDCNPFPKHIEAEVTTCQEPVCPARKDHKGKGKSKKKGKQESPIQSASTQASSNTTANVRSSESQNKSGNTNKSEHSSDNAQKKEKQTGETKGNKDDDLKVVENIGTNIEFEPIENFEDAMTSSVDDVNKTFEIIANEADSRLTETQNNPEINITAPQEDDKNSRQEKQNPVSQPKNLLGHPDIPVPSSKTDYKKEKNKPPNSRQAKVKIKDANQVEIENPEKSKESQTEFKRKLLNCKKPDESICVTNQNEDYIYKYSFRKVFLQCACHVCKNDLKSTIVPCSYCNLVFYCNQKHKDEDYSEHQSLCFAVSTIVHLKNQKFIYADSRNVTGHNYRLLRMQMIVSCEKVLKRRLSPWEQEALLYPRMCALPSCREWRQGKLVDCEGCGQISYCSEHQDHLPKSHSRWCKSYNLYRGLVKHQQTKGRLEPKLPTRVLELSPLPQNINEVLAAMYEEKIEMSDIEYAALTQLATAPLTALFCLQHRPNADGITKKTYTLHIVGAELQFEADVLNKWEVFLLHLLPNVEELRVVLVGPDLNPSNLPLDLLGKIRYCENCQRNKRRVVFGFQDKRTYHEFWASDDFTAPDLVCAFNPSIQRCSAYNGKDIWPATINCILKLKSPLAITSYTLSELTCDLLRVQECATVRFNVLCPPRNNSFASVRPDRNFISDDEAPLLFKNHCVSIVCGV